MESFNQEVFKWFFSIIPIFISILAYINSKKSRYIAKESLGIAERAERRMEVEFLRAGPSIEFLEIIRIDGKDRAKILLSNMRSTPFKINSLSLSKKVFRNKNIVNYVKSIIEPDFDWDFEKIEDHHWNPKGDLDDSEHYVKEAGKYLVVKDAEVVMVTIPDFNEVDTYTFEFNTTHGVVAATGSISTYGKTLFCNEFRQTFV